MKPEKESKAVNLPAELYNRVKERAEATGFGSVEEYVAFVLAEVLEEDDGGEKPAIDDGQEEEVKKRLKALGYLD
jgi:hypothetical protein